MRKVKILAAFLAAVVSLALLAGCGGSSGSSSPSPVSPTQQQNISGTGTFSSGPDTGDTIKLTIPTTGTCGTTSTTSTTGGTTTGIMLPPSNSNTPLMGTLVIAGSGGGSASKTLLLNGSAVTSAQNPSVVNYQLTGYEGFSGPEFTIAGQAASPALAGGTATVTSSTGDSGTINLN